MTDDELARIEKVTQAVIGGRHADELLFVVEDILPLVAEVRRLRACRLKHATIGADQRRKPGNP